MIDLAPLSTRPWAAVLALALCLAVVMPARPASCQTNADAVAPLADLRLIVRYQSGASAALKRSLNVAAGVADITALPLIDAEIWTLSQGDPRAEAARLTGVSGVRYAEPNYLWQADRIPNDPQFGAQWGLHNTGQTQGSPDADIDAAEGWDLSTGRTILIGIIDSGIDSAHADLVDNLWTNPGEISGNGVDDDGNGYVDDLHGWDFVDGDNTPYDLHGHGTHVAGIAAAVGNNGIGVAGVHWSARLVPLRFLNADGLGSNASAIQAIAYAVHAGIPITCNSWGGAPFSQALRDAIAAACDSGMLFVAAAGNNRKNVDVTPHYPAAYEIDGILSVAATDHRDRLANELLWGSNYGANAVDLAAPGVEIQSCWPGSGYVRLSGTSMAAPHVAGAAAVVWSEHPALSAGQVKSRLLNTSDPLPDLALTTKSGGRLNLRSALAEPDSLAPAWVGDLEAEQVEGTRVTLAFTAPGDDGSEGRARTYFIRYATQPFDLALPDSVFEVRSPVLPGPPGTRETLVVSSLHYGTLYHFEVTAEDDWFNRSGPSNTLVATTLGPPSVRLDSGASERTLPAGGGTSIHLMLANDGAGEMLYGTHVEYPYERAAGAAAAAEYRDTLDVLLVYADGGASGLSSILRGFDDLGKVDLWSAGVTGGSIPRYRDLRGYDVVIAWNNKVWQDPFAIGAVLAEYMDSGGAVITLVDAWGTGLFASLGRYFEAPGYSPFVSSGEALFEVRTLGAFNPDHPIMKGVENLAIGSYHNSVRLSEGAHLVASWNDGTPLVATLPGTVAINVWPGDGYHWLGDFPTLLHNAIRFAAGLDSWLDVVPAAGEIPPGDSREITLQVDARRLLDGRYGAELQFTTSDPDSPFVRHEVFLNVVGTPHLDYAAEAIEILDAYLGFPVTMFLPLRNTGTADLVIGSPSFDVGAFTAPFDSLVMKPGSLDSIPFVFSPEAVGEVWCNFDLKTNDPDRYTVRTVLHTLTALPPRAVLSAEFTAADLFAGESVVDTLEIGNAGEGDLRFHTVLRGSGTPVGGTQGVPAAATDSVPVLAWARYADLSPGNEFESLSEALVQSGSAAALEVTTTSDPDLLADLLFDKQMFLVLEQENALPDLVTIGLSFAPVLTDFVQRGGTVVFLMEWGTSAGFAAATGLMDARPVARGSRVPLRKVTPGDPLLAGLSDSLVGMNLTAWYTLHSATAQSLVTDTSGRFAVVAVAPQGAGRAVLLGFDYFSYNEDMALLLGNTVKLARRNLGWLSVSPESGVVPAGGQLELSVRFDAATLAGGSYQAEVLVETNDPIAPRHSVAAHLSVTDAPHLEAPIALELGSAFVNSVLEQPLLLRNGGNLSLRVDSLGGAGPGFEWDPAGFVLAPGTSRTVPIRLSSVAAGAYVTWLDIYSDDPGSPVDSVRISGEFQLAPRLEIDADTGRAFVHAGGRAPVHMDLRNTGGSPLEVDLRAGYAAGDDAREFLWMTLPALPTARSQAGVVVDQQGRVFVFGGYGEGNAVVPSLVVFDPATGSWQARAAMPSGDFGMAAACDSQGRVYSFAANIDQSYRYDPAADAWERISDPPVNRVWEARAALGVDGLIYLVGGEGDAPDDPLGTVQVYHPDLDYWTVASEMPTRRYGHAMVVGPGGRLYVIGGRQSFQGDPVARVEIYDPKSDTWGSAADRPVAANQFAASLGRDLKIYTAGGKTDYMHRTGPFTDEVWVYDLHLDSWMAGPPLPAAVGECQAVTSGDFIRVIGGVDTAFHADQWGLFTPAWLGQLPDDLVVRPGESLRVEWSLDAAGLDAATRRASVILLSNDPLTPVSRRPVELTVLEAPDLLLLDTSRNFAPVWLGRRDSLSVGVSNSGTTELILNAVSSAPSVFQVDPVWRVEPGSDSVFDVVFAPDAAGGIDAHLDLFANDPDQPHSTVRLSGWGMVPGSLALATTSLDLFPEPMADTSVTVRIQNSGAGVLNWKLLGAERAFTDPGGAPSRLARRDPMAASVVESDLRRLSGIVVAASDARFVPGYTLILGDLAARGARVVPFGRPYTAAQLDSLDVIVLDDYVGSLFEADLALLRDWVMRGGRLLLQNKRIHGIPEATKLLAHTGIKPFAQSYQAHVFSRMEERCKNWGIDSIAAGPSSLFCQWLAPAEALVTDDFGRGVVLAAPLGLGRVTVTSSELLDDQYVTRADTRRFVHRLIDWMAVGTPLVALPVAGDILPGDYTDVRVTTATSHVTSGLYTEHLTILSNDSLQGRFDIPVTLTVKGLAELEIDSDTLYFDTSFVGYGTQAVLEIRNPGTAPLQISGPSIQPAQFVVSDTSLTVPVFESVPLPILFAPSTEGTLEGRLTLESNAQVSSSRTIVLRATAVSPPRIDAAAGPLDLTLRAGQTGRTLLNVGNAGATDLFLSVSVLPELPGETARRPIALRTVPVRAVAGAGDSGRYTDKSTPTAAAAAAITYRGELMSFGVMDEGDVYPFRYPSDMHQLWGSGSTLAYRAGEVDMVKSSYLFAGQIRGDSLVEEKADSLHVVLRFFGHTDDDRVGIERTISFERKRKYVAVDTRVLNRTAGPLGEVVFKHYCDWDLDGNPANDNWDYDSLRQMPYGWDRHYAGLASHQSPDLLDLEGRGDYIRRATLVDFPAGPVYRYDGLPLLHFELGDIAAGAAVSIRTVLAMGDSLSDLQREIDRGLQRVKWLDTDVRSTALGPGSRFDLGLDFDATELFAGDYRARLLLASNDPSTPQAWWQVHLKVLGAPALALDHDTLDFGVVYLGYPARLPLWVANLGTDLLHIANVTTGHVTIVPDWTGLVLPPRQDTVLWLTLTPTDTGLIEGELGWVHDDTLRGEIRIPMRAQAAWPPELDVATDTLRVTLGSGAEARVPLRLFNAGAGMLQWSFSPQPYITAVPPFGILPPQTSALISLVVSAASLPPGYAITEVILNHNDPARAPVKLPLALDVFAVRRGDAYTDNRVNLRDIIYLVNTIWKGGPDPMGRSGDLDCDDAVTLSDLMFLINYVFKSGPAPDCD